MKRAALLVLLLAVVTLARADVLSTDALTGIKVRYLFVQSFGREPNGSEYCVSQSKEGAYEVSYTAWTNPPTAMRIAEVTGGEIAAYTNGLALVPPQRQSDADAYKAACLEVRHIIQGITTDNIANEADRARWQSVTNALWKLDTILFRISNQGVGNP